MTPCAASASHNARKSDAIQADAVARCAARYEMFQPPGHEKTTGANDGGKFARASSWPKRLSANFKSVLKPGT